jgi:ribonuclease HI
MKPGEARLYSILMTESAHLVWKIRCERLMQRNGTHPTETEVCNKWVLAMNNRLKLDCDMTDDRRFEKKAIPVKTVLHIWTGVLEGENKLPTDWTGVAEVLVGIRPKR